MSQTPSLKEMIDAMLARKPGYDAPVLVASLFSI
jgi:hypothetical protein